METSHDAHNWTLRQWLAFLLLLAADADGVESAGEMRYLRVELGPAVVDEMQQLLQTMEAAERDRVLQDSLPLFLRQKGARDKLQRLLRDIFMADGEYGAAEQALTSKIGDWIRAASWS